MKKCLILVLLLFTSVLSYAQKFDSVVHYKTGDFDAAIFPEQYTRVLDEDTTIKIRFTPRIDEILSAYQGLKDTTAMSKSYKWQFFGYITKKNEKLLSINCVSLSDDEIKTKWLNLKWEIVFLDGGCIEWHVLYNLNTNEVLSSMCNYEE